METSVDSAPSVAERISKLVEDNEIELPPYPEVAMRVRQTIDGDDANARELAGMIENEPALVAQVLRIANSAAYGGLQPVRDVSQAVARLGMKQVGSLVTALTLKKQFTTTNPDLRRVLQGLWGHAIATALASRFLADRTETDCEQAFLAGLLHDSGKLLVLRGVEVLAERGDPECVTEAVLDEMMVRLHTELGYLALTSWNLPEELARISKNHHEPETDPDDLLMLCVQAANLVARQAGFHPKPDPDLDLLQEPPVEALGLMDLSIATLIIDLEDEIEQKHRLFGSVGG